MCNPPFSLPVMSRVCVDCCADDRALLWMVNVSIAQTTSSLVNECNAWLSISANPQTCNFWSAPQETNRLESERATRLKTQVAWA